METVGTAMTIVSTDTGDFLVRCEDLVRTNMGESVSFTVLVPKKGQTVGELQRQAAAQAVEYLQMFLNDPRAA